MCETVDIFLRTMIDPDMMKSNFAHCVIASQFVCRNDRASFDVRHNVRHDRFGFDIFRDFGTNVALTLQYSKQRGLAFSTTTALPWSFPANIGFVSLDNALKFSRRAAHKFSNLMCHAPRRFVRHSKLTFNFLCGNSRPRCCHKVYDIEPIRKRRSRFFKDSTLHGIHLIAAPLALVTLSVLNAVEFGVPFTLRTFFDRAIPKLHYCAEAGIIIGIPLAKILDGKFHNSLHWLL